MKKIFILLFVSILMFSCKVDKNKVTDDLLLSNWIGKEVVYINEYFYEYNLYIAEKASDAVNEIIIKFFNNYYSLNDIPYLKDRFYFWEENPELSNDVKQMMENSKVNISTTQRFDLSISGAVVLKGFWVNFTEDFVNYSTWQIWDIVDVWGWSAEDELEQ